MKLILKIGTVLLILAVLMATGCTESDKDLDEISEMEHNTASNVDKNDTVKDETSISNIKDNVENLTISTDKTDEIVIENIPTVEMSTKDFLQTNGYEADVIINEHIMKVYFDTTKLTKTDIRHMIENCLNYMKNYLPNQNVVVLFYDSEDQEIAFGIIVFDKYSNSYDETTISFYDYEKYPDVDETTEKLLKSFGYDADVETRQNGMLIYFHTKGVSNSNLYSISEMCVNIMRESLPDQKSRVVISDDNDQLIADGYYIEWSDKIEIMVY